MDNEKQKLKEHKPNRFFFNQLKGQAGSFEYFTEITSRESCFCFQWFVNNELKGLAVVEVAGKVGTVHSFVGEKTIKFTYYFASICKEAGCDKIQAHRHRDLKKDGRWCEIERVYQMAIL